MTDLVSLELFKSAMLEALQETNAKLQQDGEQPSMLQDSDILMLASTLWASRYSSSRKDFMECVGEMMSRLGRSA